MSNSGSSATHIENCWVTTPHAAHISSLLIPILFTYTALVLKYTTSACNAIMERCYRRLLVQISETYRNMSHWHRHNIKHYLFPSLCNSYLLSSTIKLCPIFIYLYSFNFYKLPIVLTRFENITALVIRDLGEKGMLKNCFSYSIVKLRGVPSQVRYTTKSAKSESSLTPAHNQCKVRKMTIRAKLEPLQ